MAPVVEPVAAEQRDLVGVAEVRVLPEAAPVAGRAGLLLDPGQRQHQGREQQADPQRRPEQCPADDRVPAPRAADGLARLGNHRVRPGGDHPVRRWRLQHAPERLRTGSPAAPGDAGPVRGADGPEGGLLTVPVCGDRPVSRCRAGRGRPGGALAVAGRRRHGGRRRAGRRSSGAVEVFGAPSFGAVSVGWWPAPGTSAAPRTARRRPTVGSGTPSPVSPWMSALSASFSFGVP